MEDLTGRQFGPYQIICPFGQGGMATVYKAYQPSMDRFVAVKVLPRYHSSDPEFLGRFQQEAKSLAKLQHPHILPVHDFGEAGGFTYFVMPLMQEGTLKDLLADERLSLDRVNQIISQVGGALDFAHSQGFIHRDVKPSNVLLDKSGNCMLMDFGITKIIEGSQEFTKTGGIVGTPAYMSPEQGSGRKIDQKSDIYSLGIILYEMVTGRPPFEAETPVAVIFKHVHDPLPPPSSFNPEISEDVERVILKSLAKHPGDRFGSVRELVSALSRAVTAVQTRELMGGVMPPTVRDKDFYAAHAAPDLRDQEMMADERLEQVQPVSRMPRGKERAVEDKPGSRRRALVIGFAIVAIAVVALALGQYLFRGIPVTGVPDPIPIPTDTGITSASTDTPMPSSNPTALMTPTLLVTGTSDGTLSPSVALTLTPSPTSTSTPVPTSTKRPSPTPTRRPTSTPTRRPTDTATITPTASLTYTPSPTTPPPPPPACVPSLISPAHGAMMDNGRTDHSELKIWDFDWSDCSGASRYHLYVNGPSATIALVDNSNLSNSSFRHSDNSYIADHNRFGWTWRVRAMVNGSWGDWSATRSFDVEPVNTD